VYTPPLHLASLFRDWSVENFLDGEGDGWWARVWAVLSCACGGAGAATLALLPLRSPLTPEVLIVKTDSVDCHLPFMASETDPLIAGAKSMLLALPLIASRGSS